MQGPTFNIRPPPDSVLAEIAEYVAHAPIESPEAYETARYDLMDTLGCGILALKHSECTKLLGPLVPGMVVPNGSRVPGTSWVLDPVEAAFQIGCMNRWLDFNDTWLAAEWGHPSDNLGGILAAADFVNRQAKACCPLTMQDVLTAMIKSHEIQGVLALENSFNRVGLDHVLLVRVATAAVTTQLLGGNKEQIVNAVSNAWMDGGSLRAYRHASNTGSRKSWAAGDATSRGVRLAFWTMRGEMGYPSVLTAKVWGFYDALFKGHSFVLPRPFGSYVMENILFKIAFPAEFHAQTAVECAFQLHPKVKDRLEEIERITIQTQESAMRIIDKKGPLYNPADRDHCLQYMVAVGLIYGELTPEHYENPIAQDPRLDALREKMEVMEDPVFSRDYLDPEKRSIPNSIQIRFQDGSMTEKISVNYPLGHRRRRSEALPQLIQKFRKNLATHYSPEQQERILKVCIDPLRLNSMLVHEFMDVWCLG